VEGTLGDIPQLAAPYHMSVMLGAWVDSDKEKSEASVAKLIDIAHKNPDVKQVIVGNEVVLTGILPTEDLIAYLDKVRGSVRQPVGTAETWSTWMLHPELVDHVDFLAVHMLPYWEGLDVNEAVHYIKLRMDDLQTRYPDKEVIIDEVGWPSYGRTRHAAVASPANEAMFLRRFLAEANKREWTYRIMEASTSPGRNRPRARWAPTGASGTWTGSPSSPCAVPSCASGLAHAGGLLGADLIGAVEPDLRPQPQSAQAWPQLHRGGGVHGHHHHGVGVLRLHPAIPDRHQRRVGLLLFVGMVGVVLVLLTETHEWPKPSG